MYFADWSTDVCACDRVTIALSTEKVTVTGAFSRSPHPQLGLVTSAQISCAALAVVRGVSTLRRLRTGLTDRKSVVEGRRVGAGWAGRRGEIDERQGDC